MSKYLDMLIDKDLVIDFIESLYDIKDNRLLDLLASYHIEITKSIIEGYEAIKRGQ